MANLFPQGDSVLAAELPDEDNELKFGRSWRFDFDAGEFVLTPTGRLAQTEGAEAWLEWCRKALRTERYRYLAYSRDYGQEYGDLVGSALSRPAVESEIERITEETLMTDPRTATVGSFAFAWDADQCSFTCRVTNRLDETDTLQGSVVNR